MATEEKVDSLKPPDVCRSMSCESDASHYTDAMSNIDDEDVAADDANVVDDDFDGYYVEEDYNGDDASDPEISMNPQLYTDMENLVLIYGESSLKYRLFEMIDEIDIDLCIPLGFLEAETAEAWKVNRTEPLIVRLHLSLSTYLDTLVAPKVEVLQQSKKEKFGFGSQVRKFLENFLNSHWLTLGKDYQAYLKESQAKAMKSQSCPLGFGQKSEDMKQLQAKMYVNDKSLATLMGMGFDASLARNALIISRGRIEEASNLLLQSPEVCCDSVGPENGADGDNEQTVKKPPKPKRQHSHPPLLKQLKRMLPILNRQSSLTPSATDSNIASSSVIEDLNLLPLSTLDGKNAKNIPSIADGFLIQVFRYVRQRIPTINEYCVICDEPHVFQNGAMLKPAVCSRELCVFAFQTLGVMADAAEDIATGAAVVDLLLNMTRAASRSNRKERIFDPFPTIVDPKNPCNLMFNPKSKDFEAVQKVMDVVPSMAEMSTMTASLKKKLDEIDVGVYPLLQWIITSNRSHIVKLPQERQLEFMKTPHQFLLLSSPPAKEAVFREAKVKHGSTFAFHGSSIENWHSIIRQGLVNASGTKLQVNGAAYGKGIYLSPHISTSMGYSRMGYGSRGTKNRTTSGDKQRFLNSDNITCIAICEVITSGSLKKNNAIWVCPSEEHVCTRFFFLYEDGQVGDSSIDTQQEKYLVQLKKACGYKM